jgi:hypothetical protein
MIWVFVVYMYVIKINTGLFIMYRYGYVLFIL